MTTDRKALIQLTWKRFRTAIVMLLRSEHGGRATWFAVTLFLLMIGINGLNVVNSYVGRDFMSSIENRNLSGFRLYAMLYALVFIGSTVAAAFFRYTEERLGLLWREQLTWRLTEAYLSQRTYYRLDSHGEVANPDQRISDDVRAFTTTTMSFLLLFTNGAVTAISFSGVLWSISPRLFVVAVLYACIGSMMTILLGKPLIRLNYNQLDMEANFRADLIHVRENSESIALAHREGRFKQRLRKHLDLLVGNFGRLISVNRNLGFFTNGYNYFIQIIPALLIAPMFIHGEVQFGVITQSTMAFATLLGAFSLIVTQFQSISAFTAVTARIHLLSEAIEQSHDTPPSCIHYIDTMGHVRYRDVTILASDGQRVLVDRLDWEIAAGGRWLVVCDDDAPKVALFRSTASVWDHGSGMIERPGLEEILFLPERPYLPPGTLRDVLLRTNLDASISDAEIMAVLGNLGLETVVQRVGGLNAESDWDDAFSISEQHMLSVARIFIARPRMVFLDRPGSSLPKERIAFILEQLRAMHIGVVIFANDGESSLEYDGKLTIRPEGAWEITRAGDGKEASGLPGNLTC